MGFYGNITNTSKTQFTFDRIYPNRFTLQNSMSTDGIYIGRFVLVEYDTSGLDFYKELYKGDPTAANNLPSAPVGKTYLYSSFKATDVGSIIKLGTTAEGNTVVNGQIVYYYVNRTTAEDIPSSTWKVEFYKCVGGDANGALFEQISSSEETNYLRNYNIDKEEFGDATNLSDIGRGWDSTVWQKVYTNGIEKYVMIAELNTVIPTFDIAADAPTMTPMTPHFDTDSTNVYYKLHAQPQWGFRVKSNENITGNPINEYGEELPGSINYSTDNTKYPSDEGTVWTRSEYNRKTGEEKTYYYNPDNKTWQDTEPTTKIPAAIYFNRAGFDSEFDTQSTDLTEYISAEGWDGKKDIINISPTGQSGHSYQDHNQKGIQSVQEDIQELSIILPSIGNSIAEMWNIVYGNRDDNATYNQEQGTHNKRNRDISWEDYDNEPDRKGLRLVRKKEDGNGFEYDQSQINTLAGCINSVHDLMGMIITNTVEEDVANTSSDKIYYQTDEEGNYKYFIKHNAYDYIDFNEFIYNQVTINNSVEFNDYEFYKDTNGTAAEVYEGTTYYVKNLASDYLNNELYIKEDKNNLFKKGSLWNNKVINIPNKITLATRSDKYELIELHGFARTLNTIHGLILEINHLIDFGCKTTRDTETVQGCINVLNDIIAKFAELSPTDILVVDSYGRLHGATHTTAQTFITTTSAIAHKAENNEDTNLVEDRWIYLNVNPDALNPNITIEHRFNKVDDTETVSDLNAEASGCNGNNNLETESDILVLETPIVDNMGHVVGKNTETITLPFGFKYFETDAWSSKDIDLYTTIVENDNGSFTETKQEPDSQIVKADTTQDKMKIDPANKWIQMKYEDGEVEKLSIAHEIHGIEKSIKNKTDLNNPAVDEITIQDTEFDKAGHVIKNQNHTYILPYGYKHFQSNKISSNDQTDLDNAVNNGSSANNTQDTMNLNSANKWIQIVVNEDITEVAHEIHDVNLEERNTNMNDGETVVSVNTFDNISLQDLVFDKAGHIIENHRHNYTLPYNIKFIDSNNTEASVNDAPANKGKLSATNTQDIFFIDPSNRWVKIDTSEEKTIRIGHAYAGSDENRKYGDSNEQTPQFGATFKVPYFGVDEAGHVKTQSDHTVKIPLPSLETFSANGYSVLTGIALDAPTGKFTYTTESVGKLKLNDYTLGSDYTSIAKEDTINEALSKLQNQVNFIVDNDAEGLDSIRELVTWVNTHGAQATESFANVNKLIADNEEDIENKFTNLTNTVNSNEEDIEDKFTNLTNTVNSNEEDIEDKFTNLTNNTVKIDQYNTKIFELEGIISNLTTQIQDLKVLVESYHPNPEVTE